MPYNIPGTIAIIVLVIIILVVIVSCINVVQMCIRDRHHVRPGLLPAHP